MAQTFEEFLVEEMTRSEDEAKESHKASMNSYGAGYDAGYVAALKLIHEQMTGEMASAVVG